MNLDNLQFNEYQTKLTEDVLNELPKEVREQLVELINTVPYIQRLISIDRKRAKDLPKDKDGKIIVDLANPLDFSHGASPSLSVVNTGSLGEKIQKAFPRSKVVKTLNTMWCGIMVNPALVNNGDHNVFLCSNYEDAKEEVRKILLSFGWKVENIIDLGDLTAARGTEMFLPLWLKIYGTKKGSAFNIKVVD